MAKGTPAAEAAFASSMSPLGQDKPLSAVGPTTNGSADGPPSSRVVRSRFDTSTNVRGRNRSRVERLAVGGERAFVLGAAIHVGEDEFRKLPLRDRSQVLDVDCILVVHRDQLRRLPRCGRTGCIRRETCPRGRACHSCRHRRSPRPRRPRKDPRLRDRFPSARHCRSVWIPPMLLRLMTCSRMAISGPAPPSGSAGMRRSGSGRRASA